MDDLFGDVQQPVRDPPPRARPLTADDVRATMVTLIAALREAEAMPFTSAAFDQHVRMFPIMAQWLPPEDGQALVREFEVEAARFQSVPTLTE